MSGRLDLESLRFSLARHPDAADAVLEDGSGDELLTPAAVLVPIVLRPSSPTLLLTQRTAHLRDHAGQISFPGGRVEAGDTGAAYAALRETREEIGLAERHIEVIGYLPEYRTSTGFRVSPVVGFVTPPFELHPDPSEVADVFEVPLDFLLDPANHQQREMFWRGSLRRYHAFPYGDHFIWGATAGMIMSLQHHLTQPED